MAVPGLPLSGPPQMPLVPPQEPMVAQQDPVVPGGAPAPATPQLQTYTGMIDGQEFSIQAADPLSAQAMILNEAQRIRLQALQSDARSMGYPSDWTGPMVPGGEFEYAPRQPVVPLSEIRETDPEWFSRVRELDPQRFGELTDEQLYNQYLEQQVRDVVPSVEQWHQTLDARQAAVEQYRRDRAARPVSQKVGDWTRDLLHGGLFGGSDEFLAVMAGIDSMVNGGSFSEGFDNRLAWEREQMDAHRAENLIAATVVEMLGGVGSGTALGAAGRTFLAGAKPTTGSFALRSAADAMIYGGIYNFAEGDVWAERLQNVVDGIGLNGLMGAAFGAFAAKYARRTALDSMATIDEIRAAANANFAAARSAGLVVDGKTFDSMVDLMLRDPRLRPLADPGTRAAMDQNSAPVRVYNYLLSQRGRAEYSLETLDTMRQYLGDQVQNWTMPTSDDNLVMGMLSAFNRNVNAIPETGVVVGSGQSRDEVIHIWRNGLSLWNTSRNATEIARIFQSAADATTRRGDEERFRDIVARGFKRLLEGAPRPGEPIPGYTAEQTAAIQRVVDGGPIERSLVQLGRLAPRGLTGWVTAAGFGGTAYGAAMALGLGPEMAGTTGAITSVVSRMLGELGRRGAVALGEDSMAISRWLVNNGYIPGPSVPSSSLPTGISISTTEPIQHTVEDLRVDDEE